MIRKLDHKNQEIAIQIRGVFQASYAIEAKLLDAEDNFPPLKRPLSAFIHADTEFFGHFEDERIAGVIEVKSDRDCTHIQSLVVHPDFFRKGIASQLIYYLFTHFDSDVYTVETGAKNEPAIALYERFGFTLVKKWMTEFGIEKVAFEKN
ncbi:GNAT family N-acetyltransferase [Ekhidna sp.]|uniref:GNAT family N-acetyltransferase n=1 Tax=Ekhidna sp. TaxID=2608089 RepID=UPI003C7C5369